MGLKTLSSKCPMDPATLMPVLLPITCARRSPSSRSTHHAVLVLQVIDCG